MLKSRDNKKESDVTSTDDVVKKENGIMRMNRRRFMQMAGAVGAAVALGKFINFNLIQPAAAFYQSPGLTKFAQPIRGVGGAGIPVAVPDGRRVWDEKVALHYTLNIEKYTDKLHPDLGPTTLFGYHPKNNLGGDPTQRHLGGIIVAFKGVPIQITVNNKLPDKHILPVDISDNFPDAQLRQNAASMHLHGGFVPWISDGGPMTWFDPSGNYGPSVPSLAGNVFKLLNKNLQPGQAEYYYPNNQSARLMWYHDHAHDITRLNAYAGIASAYIIRDLFETSLILKGLPAFVELGGHEIPIIIQDKIFVGDDIATADPTWVSNTQGLPTGKGSLWYPHVYEAARWDSTPGSSQPDPSVIPEMFGDMMLANGVVFPFAPVEPRRYRLRILNACQARFLNLQLYEEIIDTATGKPTGQPDTSKPGPDFLVIGTEGGFLPNPVKVPSNQPMKYLSDGVSVDPADPGGSLITAPAERWDIIIDFSNFKGKHLILSNDAPAPFPGGDALNDHQSTNGAGPDTRTIMRFDVGTTVTSPMDLPLRITPSTSLKSGNDPLPVPLGSTTLPLGVPVRTLTLNETFDTTHGRLIQLLGTDTLPAGSSGQNFGRAYMDDATEVVTLADGKANEVWRIVNLTGDTHPIHFHLVNVQIISRQPFDTTVTTGIPPVIGTPRPPGPDEQGWKETVKMNPGEVTTVYIPFKLPKVPFKVPDSPRTGGLEYVWHCHILEHEEHDMMRPLVLKQSSD